MKGAHRRRAPYRPRLEFAIGLVALAVCGLGIGLVTADVLEKNSVPTVVLNSTTTTEPTTTTVTEPPKPTILSPTTQVIRPVVKKPDVKRHAPVASHSAPTTSSTSLAVGILTK